MSYPDYLISPSSQIFNSVLQTWAERVVVALQSQYPFNKDSNIEIDFQIANPFITDDYYKRVRNDILYVLKHLPLVNPPTISFLAYDADEISVAHLDLICQQFQARTRKKSVNLEVQSSFFLSAMLVSIDPRILDSKMPNINIIAITA